MTWEIREGDVLDRLREMPDESVHCVVTSPPYWGLRDYGTGTWEGGDAECDHRSPTMREGRSENRPKLAGSESTNQAQLIRPANSECGRCGGRRIDRQIGLVEATPAEYLARMVEVFREVRRVLRDDGTLWVNIGDGYSSRPRGSDNGWDKSRLSNPARVQKMAAAALLNGRDFDVAAKNLIGMPWRLAFALQDDGWNLRSEIIWHKSNPMPESVTDRPSKSHEQIFLPAKSARYWYDADAIREAGEGYGRSARFRGDKYSNNASFDNSADLGVTKGGGRNSFDGSGRNARTVWTIATQPFSAQGLGAYGDGTDHKVSPDCPVHGDQASRESKGSRDERRGASPSRRNPGSDRHLVPAQQAELVPTEMLHVADSTPDSLGSPLPECVPAATPHSTGSHKTDLVLLTSPRETPCEESASNTERSEPRLEVDATYGRIPESSTAADAWQGASDSDPSEQTAQSNVRKCTCLIIDHFAVFPEELPRRCIKAGTSERGVCPQCGAPWRRVVERTPMAINRSSRTHELGQTRSSGTMTQAPTSTTTGWTPTCAHPGEPAPATVLDPFAGSGTTIMVALQLGRSGVGIELNPEYAAMARRRIIGDAPLFNYVDG